MDTLNLLKESSKQFVQTSELTDIGEFYSYSKVVSTLYQLVNAIALAEKSGIERETILENIAEAREIHKQSPFSHRLQVWARGYPGDFETIEHLIHQENRATPRSFGYWLETAALSCGVAQQHRNKVRYQADLVLEAVRKGCRTNKPARILSIASGSSPDLRLVQDQIRNCDFSVVLNDIDNDALAFSQEQLAAISDKIKPVHGNTLRKINKLAEDGAFDLVLAGGLFDYLNDSAAVFLIKNVYEKLLATRGKFLFTNIASPNPYRHWLEYCTNWFLIERTESDLLALVKESGIPEDLANIKRDQTGLTIMIEITRP